VSIIDESMGISQSFNGHVPGLPQKFYAYVIR